MKDGCGNCINGCQTPDNFYVANMHVIASADRAQKRLQVEAGTWPIRQAGPQNAYAHVVRACCKNTLFGLEFHAAVCRIAFGGRIFPQVEAFLAAVHMSAGHKYEVPHAGLRCRVDEVTSAFDVDCSRLLFFRYVAKARMGNTGQMNNGVGAFYKLTEGVLIAKVSNNQ